MTGKRIKEKKEEDAAEGKGEEEEEKIRGCDVLSFFLNHQDGGLSFLFSFFLYLFFLFSFSN